VLGKRLKDINPDLELTILEVFIKEQITSNLLDSTSWDYVVDCIDTLSAKVFLIKGCLDRKLPIISSLGAGGKVDPSQISIVDISQTHECNLAKYVRKRLQSLGIRKGLQVVFSPEKVDQSRIIETEKAFPKKSIIGTLSYMPAIFGCTVASVVIRDLMAKP
jgi:tRNA A37 threonylcarbamoyladenosine dehydratase